VRTAEHGSLGTSLQTDSRWCPAAYQGGSSRRSPK
jgi:hypothetical protein